MKLLKQAVTFVILILVLQTLFTNVPIIIAQESTNETKVSYEKTNPDSLFQYGMKRTIEKSRGFITLYILKNNRPKYLIDMLKRRSNELAYTVIEEKRSYLEESSSRYTTYTGLVNEDLINFEKEEKDILRTQLEKDIVIIDYLKTKFPSDTAEWRFLQQDIESAKVLLSNVN